MDLQDKSREGGPEGTGCECSCCEAGAPEGEHPRNVPLHPGPLGTFPGWLQFSRPIMSRHARPASPSSRLPRWYLHVLPQGTGVRIGLVTHLAEIGLIGGVDVHVLLPVATVGEAPVAALKLTLERLLPCGRQTLSLVETPRVPRQQVVRGQAGRRLGGRRAGFLKEVGSPLWQNQDEINPFST